MTVHFETDKSVAIITIDRPDVSNAVDGPTGEALVNAFQKFDNDPELRIAVFTGAGRRFCAGNDLKSMQRDDESDRIPLTLNGNAPCGVTRMLLNKPVIAAIEGFAVAGGLELACWCDVRVAAEDAAFGVYCRRWGIPLMDGGTIRLPRLIGHSHALDLILTGRAVSGEEARMMGLANRIVPKGEALNAALALAHNLAELPPSAMRSDRKSSYQQWHLDMEAALTNEFHHGKDTIATGEMIEGLKRYQAGAWRQKTL